jgi:hypothetical protein
LGGRWLGEAEFAHVGGITVGQPVISELVMLMMENANRLILHVVPGQDSDAEELADLANQLRAELLEMDVASVAPLTADEAPEGAKGIGQLAGWLVAQLGTLEGLKPLVAAVIRWAARTQRTVEISVDGDTLKVSAATAQQQEEIINAWLARHETRA